jgi:hypothetical protein
MKVITISILVDCHRVTTDYLYVLFRLWILIIFVLPFFDYISEYVYEYGHTYSNIIVYVSSCLYSFKRNMFIRWLNPLISHGSLIDETTTIALLTFSFLLSCFFFKFVLRLSRNDMSFFKLVICRDIMFLILLYIYDAPCHRYKVLEYACGVMYRVINTSKVNLVLSYDEHAHA